jgi:hypothetical protein
MKKIKCCSTLFLVAIFLLGGCNQQGKIGNNAVINTTKAIQYQISLERQTLVKLSSSNNPESQKMTENLDLVLSCQPMPNDAKGAISCKLTIDSIQAKKVDFIQTFISADSVADLAGKSFTAAISADGTISSPELEQELKRLSANSFEEVKRPGARLKSLDFLPDMWEIQSILLESILVNKNTTALQTTNQLPFPIADIPGPVVLTTWQQKKDGAGTLTAESVLTDQSPQNPLPLIYPGQFKIDGLLGYLRNCKYESVTGNTTCRINPENGLPDEIIHKREIQASAYYMLTDSNKPSSITVTETLSIRKQ